MGSTAQKQISLVVAVAGTFFFTYQSIVSLSFLRSTDDPQAYLIKSALALLGFFIPIIAGWFSFRLPGGVFFAILALGIVLFTCIVSGSWSFSWYILAYGILLTLFYRVDEKFENEIAAVSVDRETHQNQKNDLTLSYKSKGEAMSTLFEKYSTYYNMRKLAEELAASLSVTDLCQIVVNRSLDFIHRGDLSVLALAHPDGQSFPVMAHRFAKTAGGEEPFASHPSTDIFDHWVIKNRRRLIITDSYQDFRFDAKEAEKNAPIRSLIASPLVQDARVIGLLRINAYKPEAFSNDDLRLLDNIAMLAAAALSNAILYEQTKELAIKDFLTGLFVRRYFFERLKDEHRRALTTQRPLSLLMCDLDHFKHCNDQYGHGAGDQMLIHFSRVLKETAENAIVARYGGEEFSVLLPETDKQGAYQLAQKIRTALKSRPFVIRRETINTTVSIGVSSQPEDAMDYESLIQKADHALYDAKKSGRDRVC